MCLRRNAYYIDHQHVDGHALKIQSQKDLKLAPLDVQAKEIDVPDARVCEVVRHRTARHGVGFRDATVIVALRRSSCHLCST